MVTSASYSTALRLPAPDADDWTKRSQLVLGELAELVGY
jgi:hypothetical protein